MIAAGIQEPIVRRIMGHKSAIITRHYTHVHADQVRDAMSRFSEALEAAAPEKERGER